MVIKFQGEIILQSGEFQCPKTLQIREFQGKKILISDHFRVLKLSTLPKTLQSRDGIYVQFFKPNSIKVISKSKKSSTRGRWTYSSKTNTSSSCRWSTISNEYMHMFMCQFFEPNPIQAISKSTNSSTGAGGCIHQGPVQDHNVGGKMFHNTVCP